MSEEKTGSSSKLPEEEKPRPASTPPVPPAQHPTEASPVPPVQRPAAPAAPPRPAAQPPRPAAPPPPTARPQVPKSLGRRNFVKALVAVGAILSISPFVPWGSFLSSSVSSTGAYKRQAAVVDNSPSYGAAAGKQVNVNDLTTFPPNGSWVVTYPSSGDPTLDAQNPDTFVKFALIRLPSELGGSETAATAFVGFSKVCVHLWCSPNYDPEHATTPTDETYQCPCHGSIYRVPDGLSIAGPASQQPPPTNAIPMLTLTADSNGLLYIEPPVWDVDHNGVIGYGRNYQSYDTYIKPEAEGQSG